MCKDTIASYLGIDPLSNDLLKEIFDYSYSKTDENISSPTLGMKFSDDTKKLMSLAKRGKPQSEEHKLKRSLSLKGKKHKLPNSEETKLRKSLSAKMRCIKKKWNIGHVANDNISPFQNS
jgi:hypothetical protein